MNTSGRKEWQRPGSSGRSVGGKLGLKGGRRNPGVRQFAASDMSLGPLTA